MISPRRLPLFVLLLAAGAVAPSEARADDKAPASFSEDVQPLLEQYCYACHGLGSKKGGVTLDAFADDEAARRDRKLWLAGLKNVRSGTMPPAGKPRPSAEEREGDGDLDQAGSGASGIDP